MLINGVPCPASGMVTRKKIVGLSACYYYNICRQPLTSPYHRSLGPFVQCIHANHRNNTTLAAGEPWSVSKGTNRKMRGADNGPFLYGHKDHKAASLRRRRSTHSAPPTILSGGVARQYYVGRIKVG